MSNLNHLRDLVAAAAVPLPQNVLEGLRKAASTLAEQLAVEATTEDVLKTKTVRMSKYARHVPKTLAARFPVDVFKSWNTYDLWCYRHYSYRKATSAIARGEPVRSTHMIVDPGEPDVSLLKRVNREVSAR